MPKISNSEFAARIHDATSQDRIDWTLTAQSLCFLATFAGKYILESWPNSLNVKDSEGDRILRITSDEDGRITEINEMARRYANKIDDKLVDLLSEIDKPRE